jgi:serine/threonine protein kinase
LLFETNEPDSKIKICDFGFAKRDIGNALETPIGTVAYVGTHFIDENNEVHTQSLFID